MRRLCALSASLFLTLVPITAQSQAGAGKPPAAPAAPQVVRLKQNLTGTFVYRFVSGASSAAPAPLPPPGADGSAVLGLPAGASPGKTVLEIDDTGRGNSALIPIPSGKNPLVALSEASFNLVDRVSVPVDSDGVPVSGPEVDLQAKGMAAPQSVVLSPSDQGVARFSLVPLGAPVKVTVRFGSHSPISQTQTISLDHPAGGFSWQPIDTHWADAAKLQTAPPAAAASPTASPDNGAHSEPAESAGGGISSLINTVLILALIAALGYGLYWAVITGRVKTLLDRAGIDTAPIAAAGTAPANPFTKPELAPIQPITEATAEPFGPGPEAAGVTISDGPRLIGTMGSYSGSIFPLAGSSADIGRDNANAISLPQDNNASRRHASVRVDGAQYSITDLGSSNGTFVNGVRIQAHAPQPLRP
ncbi:MAG TPA: FHA domain-containing protein, partial [Chthonomonadales bacterium]|nr:FHA domain-containing protein [Chthonomonadales bacterium]